MTMNNEKKTSAPELPLFDSPPKKIEKLQWRSCLRQNVLTILMFLSVVVGVSLGLGLRSLDDESAKERYWTKRKIMYLSFPGELFLRMLQCLILPLIVSSLISAVGSLDTKLSAKIGLRSIIYYLVTTLLAIILGIILVISIGPGRGDTNAIGESLQKKPSTTADTLLDLIRNMFPPNIAQAAISQTSTVLKRPKNVSENDTDYYNWDISHTTSNSMNILGIVVFTIVLGVTIGRMKEQGRPLLDFFTCLGDAMMIITKWVIWLSPVGVTFLVAGKIVEMKSLSVIAGQVGLYTATVLTGLFIHVFVVLPLIYFIILRRQPYGFMCNMAQAIATAFGTSSSSATLPVAIACLEDKNGIDVRVSRFCLPVGATINMDGTALYEAVAAIFIAQVRRVPLDIGKIIAVSVTATAASIGAAGIPQAGLVTMVMVLNAVGLPADDVALILVVDWFLDRFRTSVNVMGDSLGAGIVAHLSKKDLESPHKDEVKEISNEISMHGLEVPKDLNTSYREITSM